MKRDLEGWLDQIEKKWQEIPEADIDTSKLQHLALICDGNRRAARARGLQPYLGHQVGVEVIRGVARAGRAWNISALTFWVWSTENWSRDKSQTEFVMDLAASNLGREDLKAELQDNEVRFKQLGRRDRLGSKLRQVIDKLEELTQSNTRFHLNLALDYGGVDEVARAMSRILLASKQGEFDLSALLKDPRLIYKHLDTEDQPLPDLVVRTGNASGEIPHTSGFMPLQTAYSTWEFLPVLFPNLTPQILLRSVNRFLNYDKRRGR